MQFLSQLRLAPRLAVAFGALTVASAIVVGFGITRLSDLTHALTLIGADRVPKVQQVDDVTDRVNLIARELRNALIWDDAAKAEESIAIAVNARSEIGGLLDKLDETIKSTEGQRRIDAVKAARAAFVPMQEQFIADVRAGRRDAARALVAGPLRATQLAYMKALDDLTSFQIGLIDVAVKEGQADYERSKAVMFGLLALMIVGSALLGWLIARSVADPVRRVVESAGRIAQGDLTEQIDARGRDETADLLRAVGAMQASLRTVVDQVRGGVESVTTASAQIAAGNQDLSSRTEQQASSLQETAASMDQLTSTVSQTADNARQANQLASAASTAAAKGGEVVGQVVSTMEQISASSQKIADIIGTIDGIAFQTNILALNAAVEAARAGEQGRGFAVVAAEVRSLAQRSAQAAREIKTLISDSVEKVDSGSRLVNDAGVAMQDIVGQVRRVTDLVGEITSAAVEQSSGIGQVNDAVSQMDQVTQQNAALVEESAAAAASLNQQARRLSEVVSVFKLDGHPGRAPAPDAAPDLPVATPAHAGPERRGPGRATNVTRPAFGAKAQPTPAATADSAAAPAKTGTDDWTTF